MKVLHAAIAATILAGSIAASAAESSEPGGEAPPALIPLERFADRPEVGNAVIAPDGRHAALITAPSGQTQVVILDLDSRKPTSRLRLGETMDFNWYRWAGPDILLISIRQLTSLYGVEFPITRLVALNTTNGQQWHVGPEKMGFEGDDVLHVAKDGSSVLLSYQKTIWDDPSVYRVSLRDPKDKGVKVQGPAPGISEWYADDDGVVRLGTGWSGNKLRITYRANAQDSSAKSRG